MEFNEARLIILRLRATESEHKLMERLTKLESMNASEFIRQAIRETAKARRIPTMRISRI